MKANIEKDAVPDGWQGVRLGDVGEVVMGQSPPGEVVVDWDGDELDVDGLPFVQGNAEFGTKYPAPLKWCLQPYKVGIPGDILISVRAPVGETNRVATQLGIGRGLAAVRFEKESQPFGWHVLNRSKSDLDRVTQGSTFAAIGGGELRNLPILLPPLPEQRAIAAVLDSIDDAIEGAEAVIAATEGLRDALLHDLLTRGLPGQHTEFREVPGLGTIPADWEVVRLGDVAETITSGSRAWSRHFRPAGALFVRSQNIVNGLIDRSDPVFVEAPNDKEAERTRIRGDDILVSITGEPGKATVADESMGEAYVSQHVALVRPRDTQSAKYLCRALQCKIGQEQFSRMAYGQTRPGLNLSDVGAATVAFAPISEQRNITSVLDAAEATVEVAREELAGLRLLKESTADGLLTGRVRVASRH